jgi:hypothetical protein
LSQIEYQLACSYEVSDLFADTEWHHDLRQVFVPVRMKFRIHTFRGCAALHFTYLPRVSQVRAVRAFRARPAWGLSSRPCEPSSRSVPMPGRGRKV